MRRDAFFCLILRQDFFRFFVLPVSFSMECFTDFPGCLLLVDLSRTLYGLTMHSERRGHRMCEQWHPPGPVGVVTAFNFPLAVLSWNAMVAMAGGDTVIRKPWSKTPLTALAVLDYPVEQGIRNIFLT